MTTRFSITRDAAYADPALAAALRTPHGIVRDIADKLDRYGRMSEAQRDLVMKLAGQHAAEKANAGTVLAGRQTITGTVLSAQWRDSYSGSTAKALVLVDTPDGPVKLWGTIPSILVDLIADRSRTVSVRNGHYSQEAGTLSAARGATLTFTGTVEPSRDDNAFGFWSRPHGGTVDAWGPAGTPLPDNGIPVNDTTVANVRWVIDGLRYDGDNADSNAEAIARRLTRMRAGAVNPGDGDRVDDLFAMLRREVARVAAERADAARAGDPQPVEGDSLAPKDADGACSACGFPDCACVADDVVWGEPVEVAR